MSDMYRPVARIIGPGTDYTDPLQRDYKVYLYRRHPDGTEVMMADGRWQRIPDGEALHPEIGLRIPADYAAPLYEALRAALGHDKPDDVAVLREWLEAERSRTDRVLDNLTAYPVVE